MAGVEEAEEDLSHMKTSGGGVNGASGQSEGGKGHTKEDWPRQTEEEHIEWKDRWHPHAASRKR